MSMPRHDYDRAMRDYYLSRTPVPIQSAAVTAAYTSVPTLEVPWAGRTNGALQVFSTDGNAISATFKVQGTLLDPTTQTVGDGGTTPMTKFRVKGADTDWIDLATQAGAGIVQFTGGYFSRVRVICSVFGSGLPGVRLL